MVEVDGDRGPVVEPERPSAAAGADGEELVGAESLAGHRLAPRDSGKLSELLERIDAHVRVGADAERDAALGQAADGSEPVTEIGLGRRTQADSRPDPGDKVKLVIVRVRGVNDRRPRG